MNYGLIYTIPFASLNNEACLIKIELDGYTGAVMELTPSDSPFNVEIDDNDFLYTPSRFSTATIRIVGNDYLQSLFSTAYQQYRVTFKRNNTILWCGFIKPEIYTQDYEADKFELEIECMSALSTLEYINYQPEEEKRKFISLWALLQKCVQSANSQYSAVYLPRVYASSLAQYNAGENVLEKMTVSEQNFFDEDDEAMTLKEVLEEICKLLSWTVCDWHGELFFVDVDHQGQYYRYDGSLTNRVSETNGNLINVQTAGFSSNGHTLDILPGYNKATVRVSNYPVGQLIPEEEFSQKEMYDSYKTINDKYTEETYVQGMILDSWRLKAYGEHFPLGSGNIYELTDEQVRATGARINYNSLLGASAYRVGTVDAERSGGGYKITGANYAWKTLIRYRVNSGIEGKPILKVKGATATYRHGAIGIEANILFTTNYANPHEVTIQDFHVLRFSLRIGREYWNGTSWQASEATFDVGIGKVGETVERTSVRGTKTADMPYEGLTGYIIQFPDDRVLIGELEITMYAVNYPYQQDKRIGIVDIEDLKLSYQKKDSAIDKDDNSDRYYENVVNESYINKLDEIEFKISSYNNDGSCYSKVLLGDNYLENNLYASVAEELIRPEELLIRRIVNRYDVTRVKLIQVIQETPNLTPLTKLSDNFMVNKIFINAGGSIDYKMGQFKCAMIEI